MPSKKQKLGQVGERVVAAYLVERGYRILAMNQHTKWGEIDIIAARAQSIHAVEVKTRTNYNFGGPESAMTKAKFKRLRRALLTLKREKLPFLKVSAQIDLASVLLDDGTPKITMIWNIGQDDFN